MKMKKAVSLALAAVMTCGMVAGCGSSASSSASTAASETTSTAADGSVFKIGVIGPLTGSASAYGTAVANATKLAADEINAAGGMNGYQVEILTQDDELDSTKSVNAYNTLKDQGMQILNGSVTSACSIAVSEMTKQDNMFQITPSGTAQDCTKYDNVFRACFSDPQQGVLSADYIADQKIGTKIGIIYDSSDTYSSGIRDAFTAEAKTKGLEIVSDEAFNADNKTDFSVQLQKAKDGGAEVLFMPFYYTEAALVLQQAKTMGYAPTFFGVDGMDGILTVDNFDASLADGLMLLCPFSAYATDDKTTAFVKAYQDAYNEVPNQFGADAYDAMYAIKAAIEKGGVTPDMDISAICESMKTAMTQITIDGLTGNGITWDASGEPSKQPRVYQIQDGAYIEK